MIGSILSDVGEFPLDILTGEDHEKRCDAACYRCLLRYENQPYHGLLDWRLGLAYLQALVDPGFRCGLDGHFDHYGLTGWTRQAETFATQMATRFGGESRVLAGGLVPAFRVRDGSKLTPWVVVAHPLWEWDDAEGPADGTILAQAYDEVAESDGTVLSWDTFNLARRQVQVRAAVLRHGR